MREVIATLNASPRSFKERQTLKFLEQPWQGLKSAPAEQQVAFLFEALSNIPSAKDISFQLALKGLASNLLRGGLPLNTLDTVRMVEMVSQRRESFPYKAVLSALENVSMTPALKDALLRLRPMIDIWHGRTEMQEIHERIDHLVHGAPPKSQSRPSAAGRGTFSRKSTLRPSKCPGALFFSTRARSPKAPPRASGKPRPLHMSTKIGRAEFLEAAHRWLALGPMPEMPPQQQVPDDEADYQKGFIWTLGALGDASVAADIADFAFACFRKIPQIGAVSHRVGNACVNALAVMPGLERGDTNQPAGHAREVRRCAPVDRKSAGGGGRTQPRRSG